MNRDRVVLVILASATLYGIVSIAVRVLLVGGVPVEATVAARFATSAVLLLLVPRFIGLRSIATNRTRLTLFVLGAVLVGLQAIVLFTALRVGSTAPVIFLFFTFPFWVAVFSAVARLERITLSGAMALGLAGAGALLVIAPPDTSDAVSPFAASLALLAAAMYGGFLVLTARLLRDIGRVEGAGWVAAGATLFSGIATILAVRDAAPPTPTQFLLLGATGILGTAALLGYFYGLGRAGGNTVALFGMWEPVVVAILAAGLLHESLAVLQVVGGVIVLVALLLRVSGQRTVPPTISPAVS